MPAKQRLTGYRIGDITLDLTNRRIERRGCRLDCGRLTFDLLAVLASRAPDVVSRDELVDSVWNGRYVSPATIKQRILLLRHTLGDHADDPAYIRVLRGQGCGLIPRVQPIYSQRFELARWQRYGIAAGVLLLIFVLGAEIGYRDGTRSRGPGLDSSMSIVLTSWPMPVDEDIDRVDGARFVNELPKKDYAFVMSLAGDLLDVLNAGDYSARLNEIQGSDSVSDEAALTLIVNATTNDVDQVNVRFTVLNEAVSDDRIERAYFRESFAQRLARVLASMPDTVTITDRGGGPPTRLAIPDQTISFVPEGRHGDRNFVLTADFVFDRGEIADDPATLQRDAVETVAMAIDEQLPGLASFEMIPLSGFRRMSQGDSEAR